jgi:hypothetical protein
VTRPSAISVDDTQRRRSQNQQQLSPALPFVPDSPELQTHRKHYQNFRTGTNVAFSALHSSNKAMSLAAHASAADCTQPSLMLLPDELEQWTQVVLVLSKSPFSGINRKVQIKPSEWDGPRCSKALFILKWGGELSPAGVAQARSTADTAACCNAVQHVATQYESTAVRRHSARTVGLGILLCLQAEMLGRRFRSEMYPEDGADPGQGLLRLHSTYRYFTLASPSVLNSHTNPSAKLCHSVPLWPQAVRSPSQLLALAADR